MSGVYVPFPRTIRVGAAGRDVLAVKRALSRAGYIRWGGFTSIFGPYAAISLKRFQAKERLKQDGIYGEASHRHLAPYFDAYGAWLMGQAAETPELRKRRSIVAAAMFGYTSRNSIHYSQAAGYRMWGVRHRIRPPSVPVWEDCSSFATWCYWVADAPDPNGLGYSGYGFTGTQIGHGRMVHPDELEPGDLVFYGRRSIPSHVAVYVGSGRVVSHGSEAGPLLLPRTYRSDVHSHRSYL